MKEKIIEFLKTNWKKVGIVVAVILAVVLSYGAGCKKGCDMSKSKVEQSK